ncbi:hypothetical protein HHI36_020807 [Cryptolaemus montrouzieri]|uniref:Uncharacterized protein n=1 Tax=Cryptolaemus montrouzieri TaxID=559131 RepID=A0ABD2ND09_9CUCU
MDLLEIKSEPPEEFIHMNKNEILKDEFTGETKEILNQEFLIKCENDENETIIPKIEVGLSENELTDKESINENETILLEQGDRNKMNNPRVKENCLKKTIKQLYINLLILMEKYGMTN